MKEKGLQLIAKKYKGLVEISTNKLYVKEFQTLGEMEKFLDKYNIPKLNEEEARSLNRPIAAHEISHKKITKKTPNTQKPWSR